MAASTATESTDNGGASPMAAVPWYRRWSLGKNRYDATELAGAFGDLGTLIPFVVGFIVVMRLDPLGILFTFGLSEILVGLFYKTPIPVQPMKAIGGAAIASGGAMSPGMICGAGLFTGLFWFLAGTTKTVSLATKLAAKPIVRGIVLGLGLTFITEGVRMMLITPWLGGAGLLIAFILLSYPRFPAMFALLLIGAVAAYILDPECGRYHSNAANEAAPLEFGFSADNPALRGRPRGSLRGLPRSQSAPRTEVERKKIPEAERERQQINALVEAPIHARANGYVKRWLLDIGAQVKAGQLLAEIEAPELVQELERARAEFGQAEAALALAKTTASRFAELVKSGSVGEQETAEKEADFRVKSATADAARANVRRLQELLSYTRVTAPFEGTVTARKTDVGDLVVAGGNKELFRLAQTRTLRVFVRVPQAWSRAVAVGQAADLVIPELPGRAFPAKVVRTAGAMAEESRTLLVELEVDNGKHEILAGSYGEVRFVDAKRPPALTLPSNALLLRAEGPQAAVVQANGQVELRSASWRSRREAGSPRSHSPTARRFARRCRAPRRCRWLPMSASVPEVLSGRSAPSSASACPRSR